MPRAVKCLYCGESFIRIDTPEEEKNYLYLDKKRRYAHLACHLKFEEENKPKQQFEDYVKELLKAEFLPPFTQNRIKFFMSEYNYTYSGMYKTLKYYYEVKKGPKKPLVQSLAIIPYIYKEAHDYYYAVWEANQRNEQYTLPAEIYQEQIVKIPVPQKRIIKKKYFTFLDEEVKNGEQV